MLDGLFAIIVVFYFLHRFSGLWLGHSKTFKLHRVRRNVLVKLKDYFKTKSVCGMWIDDWLIFEINSPTPPTEVS